MMSPQLAASLTALVGVSMVAGWLSAFRNRAYLGWLGFAFLTFSASLLAAARASQDQALGMANPHMALLAKVLLGACALCFLLALVAAAQETSRRLQDIRTRHQAAEEALLAMMQAQQRRDGPDSAQDDADSVGPGHRTPPLNPTDGKPPK